MRSSALVFLLAAWAPSAAQAQSKRASEALRYLDDDAGAVVAMRISQLQELSELVMASAPDARGSISLATLGASAVLGWNPLQSSAWQARGFSASDKLYLQLEAIDKDEAAKADRGQGTALWRTRMVLPAKDAALAKKALSGIRFRQAASLEDKDSKPLAALLKLNDKQARKLKAKLQRAGVFHLAKPAVVAGLLVMSQHQDHFVIDLLRPYGPWNQRPEWSKSQDALLRAVSRRSNGRRQEARAQSLFRDAPIGVLVRPGRVSELLLARELDGMAKQAPLRKSPACAPFQELAGNSHFSALALGAEVKAKSLWLDLSWQLREKSRLPSQLTTKNAPLLAADSQALHALLRLDQIGGLLAGKRSALTQNWDSLWKKSNDCHPLASSFAIAIDWPNIAGLFLEEVAALHPQANTLIANLGAMAIASHGQGEAQELVAEAWVREEGVAIADNWLTVLFGHKKKKGHATRWGRGRMRPYALAQLGGGSVIGSDLIGTGAGHPSLPGLRAAARVSSGKTPFVLRARPSELRPGLLDIPLAGLLSAWQRLSAELTLHKDHLRFTIHLQKD